MGVEIYERRVRHAPRDIQALNNLSIQLMLLGELERAAATLRTALRIDPTYPSALKNLRVLDKALQSGCDSVCEARVAAQADNGIRVLSSHWPAVPNPWYEAPDATE